VACSWRHSSLILSLCLTSETLTTPVCRLRLRGDGSTSWLLLLLSFVRVRPESAAVQSLRIFFLLLNPDPKFIFLLLLVKPLYNILMGWSCSWSQLLWDRVKLGLKGHIIPHWECSSADGSPAWEGPHPALLHNDVLLHVWHLIVEPSYGINKFIQVESGSLGLVLQGRPLKLLQFAKEWSQYLQQFGGQCWDVYLCSRYKAVVIWI
jgi:hypothetical protein